MRFENVACAASSADPDPNVNRIVLNAHAHNVGRQIRLLAAKRFPFASQGRSAGMLASKSVNP
jgi:hypothetical protein